MWFFRKAADDVLDAAKQVIALLEEAEKHQDNATAANSDAKVNIDEANAFLRIVRLPIPIHRPLTHTRSFAYAKEASRIIIFSVFPRFKHFLENGFQTEEETKEGGDTAERSIDRLADLMRRLEDLKVKYKTLKDKVNQAVEEADKAQDAADETEEVRVVTFEV